MKRLMTNCKFVLALGLLTVVLACAPTKKISGRVARGPLTRSNGTNNSIIANAAAGFQPMGDVSPFFSNYMNSNGTPFVLPCPISQISVAAAHVSAPADPVNGSIYTSVPTTGAQLNMNFLLSCTATDPDNNQQYNNIEVDIGDSYPGFVGAGGEVDGNYATISFSDGLGTITFSGTLSGGQFSGTISYANNFYYDSSGVQQPEGASGYLSNFSLPACNVFNCNTMSTGYQFY